MALSSSGSSINTAAIWLQNNGLNNVIQAAIDTYNQIAPPSSVSPIQSVIEFGVFQDAQKTSHGQLALLRM